jgi:putative ABC transport system permease protein
MSLWKIAWRSIEQRGLASALTVLSIALGVSLVVTVLVVHELVDRSFRRGAQGYNLVVGANKRSGLELVLSTVYHLGGPVENLPYSYWHKFTDGEFASDVEAAIPVCVGDNYQGFRVVGTLPEMFTKLQYLEGQSYQFAAGRNFNLAGHDEVVLGAEVARKTGRKVGDTVQTEHGLDSAPGGGEKHEPLHVVGVLARTDTPVDRALYMSIDGFHHLKGHSHAPAPAGGAAHHTEHAGEKKHADDHHDHGHDGDHAHDHHDHGAALSDDAQQVSAILVNAKPWKVLNLARRINQESVAQAALPAREIADLFDRVVGNLQLLLLLMAVMVVMVAGIGMLVSIYNSMSDRRREIAIMRALGARRRTVMAVVLLESILLALGGGALGVLLGHGLVALLGPAIQEQVGVAVDSFRLQWVELALVPGLIVLAAVIGYLPAVIAYRTDVAKSLAGSA